jgi:hypothetical protein
MEEMDELGIDYVLVSPKDRNQGDLIWLDHLSLVFSAGKYAMYEVSK